MNGHSDVRPDAPNDWSLPVGLVPDPRAQAPIFVRQQGVLEHPMTGSCRHSPSSCRHGFGDGGRRKTRREEGEAGSGGRQKG
eukprot:2002915-Pyramimonas_sp.AAC.1